MSRVIIANRIAVMSAVNLLQCAICITFIRMKSLQSYTFYRLDDPLLHIAAKLWNDETRQLHGTVNDDSVACGMSTGYHSALLYMPTALESMMEKVGL